MTAYDRNLPCLNPNCSSHGTPHPNCRCYGFAEGGDVGHFCGSENPHSTGCEYFADGGDTWDGTAAAPEAAAEWESAPVEAAPEWESPPTDAAPDYNKPGQGILAEAEGLGRGLTGPLSTSAELGLSNMGVPGLSAADQAGRQAEFPVASTAAETAGNMVQTAAMAPEEAAIAGGKAIYGAVTGGISQTSNEINKAMLGQGDPEAPVSSALMNIGAASLFGAATGALGSVASNQLKSLASKNYGARINSFLQGAGVVSRGFPEMVNTADKDAVAGAKFVAEGIPKVIQNGLQKAVERAAISTGSYAMGKGSMEGMAGSTVTGLLAQPIAKILGRPITGAAEYALPKILNTVQRTTDKYPSILGAIDHADNVTGGMQKSATAIESLFKSGGVQSASAAAPDSGLREKLRDYITNGGIEQNIDATRQQQAEPQYGMGGMGSLPFAEGGEVPAPAKAPKPKDIAPIGDDTDPIAEHFPDQNILMNAAKGRISNYLTGLQPQKNVAKLAFDPEPDTRTADKSYNKALDIANDPLSVLQHIKAGTVEPEHIKHLNSMYPEVTNQLQKQLTARISEAQMNGEKPTYKVRQGLSMLLGTPLSGEMSPTSIQAAQAIFAPQPAPPQQPTAKPKNKSGLNKTAESYRTADQAADARAASEK